MKTKPAQQTKTATGENAASHLKLNNILVPIDFSDGSKKALQYAVHFARQFNTCLVLLHVLPRQKAAEKELATRLKAWAEEFVPGEVASQMEISRGIEVLEIVEAAKKFGTGLMVISTHGRTGRAHSLAGSQAENLVQLAPCPVLVVREHENDFIETEDSKTKQMPSFIGMSI